jgi:quercetin dioxygenase-like cupin family protein
MSDFHIFHPDQMTPVDRGNGIRSFPFTGEDTGADVLLTGMSVFPEGTAIPLHTHSREEVVVLLEGDGMCEVNGETHAVKRLTTTYVPANMPHRFVNTGNGQMRILWIYGGTDTTRTFVESGETVGHMERYREPGS